MQLTSIKAILNFKNASILPTLGIAYDNETDELFVNIEVIQHCATEDFPIGIRQERMRMPGGHRLIEAIRGKTSQ